MSFRKKTTTALVVLMTSICLSLPVFGEDVFVSKDIHLYVNNQEIQQLPMRPVFYNNYLLVPSREVFEPLGAYIEYQPKEKRVNIIYDDKLLSIQVDNTIATIDDEPIQLSIPPKIINNKLLIPLRDVSENLGLSIQWDGNTYSAYVDKIDPTVLTNDTQESTDAVLSDKIYIRSVEVPTAYLGKRAEIVASTKIQTYETNQLVDGRLILDFYNAYSMIAYNEKKVTDSTYFSSIRIGMNTENDIHKTRIVLDLTGNKVPEIHLSEDGTRLYVDFENIEAVPVEEKTTTENNNAPTPAPTTTGTKKDSLTYVDIGAEPIIFDKMNNILIVSKVPGITVDTAQEYDDYNNGKYIITFPANLTYLKSAQKFQPNNNYIKDIEIQNINSKTQVFINEKMILAPIIYEDENNLYIKMVLPKERYGKIVVVDAGHGGTDAGAVRGDLKEKDINFAVAQKLVDLMEQDADIKGYLTRSEDVFITLEDRVKYAKGLGDIFISLHANANPNEAPSGIDTFYYENAKVNQLGFTSKELARIVQKNLITYTGAKDRMVKTEAFYVIKYNEIPAILVELGFVSNTEEGKLLATDAYRDKLAQALYVSVLETFNQYTPAR